jgi:putative ABC transport system permease protein
MLNDVRFALRMMASHPWFSGFVVGTLALSIGVNTTVFTLANAALFKPVPVPRGERLVAIDEKSPNEPGNKRRVSLPEYLDYRGQARTLSAIEAARKHQAVISETGNPPERYNMADVSPGLFEMLRTPPVLGRQFAPADAENGAAPVALIGYGVWQKRYAGAADVAGRVVRINGNPATIVGVMPEGFRFPQAEDLWMPIVRTKASEDRNYRDLMVFGLLAPGVGMKEAQNDLDVITARLAKTYPDSEKDTVALVETFQQAFNGGPIKSIFLLMLGAVGFVLLIACANVANMMLGRALSRSREIALRAALGASRWQIIRQLLVESVMLSVLGGLLGMLLAQFGVHAFDMASQDVGKPYWVQFTMDWRVYAYFAALSVLTGIIFGIVPALRASRVDLNTALKDGTAGSGWRGGRLAGALVVFQFALTVVLLAGAGVMMKSFMTAAHMNPFVPAEHILTARMSLPDGKGERYESVESRRRMHEKVLERLGSIPGVTQAALASDMPGLGAQTRDLEIEGRPNPDPKHPPQVTAVFASPSYLPTIGLPVLLGRGLEATDGGEGKEASVVTRAFAASYWPGLSPVGRRFRFLPGEKPGPWITVVGVCSDLVQNSMEQNPPPLAYFSNRQEPWAWLGIVLRTTGDPESLASSARAAMQGLDPDLPVFEVRTLNDAIDHQFWFLKVFGTLFLSFALIALLMASVGIYAVVAQATSRRTREIGIRMALGASAARIVRMVLSRGMLQMGTGLGIGLAGAIAAARLMAGLPGMASTKDPWMFCGVVAVLAATGLLACLLPARRAAHVPPTEALRTD